MMKDTNVLEDQHKILIHFKDISEFGLCNIFCQTILVSLKVKSTQVYSFIF